MKKLMTGDEAVARGAYEAGVRYASAYPGTPSTEILENIAIDDMKHFKKLGQLLMTLGANPAINTKFRAGGANMFPSAEDKRTDSMASSVADYLIAQKSAAVDKYSNILKDAPDISIMNIINSITSDEQKHRHMLMNYCMYI